jgi:hypothetical protein
VTVALNELVHGPVELRLTADEAARTRIARALDLVEVIALETSLKLSPWLDGVEISGEWSARIVQICGVSLDPFETALTGALAIRAVPQGSAALGESAEHELDLDPASDDPPEALETNQVPVGAYVVEDLSLAVDPFPRKPGVTFEAPPAEAEPSPFAVLLKLKRDAGDN